MGDSRDVPTDPVERTRRTYDQVAHEYDDSVGDTDELEPILVPFESQLPDGARVLDLGCGPGRDAAWFTVRGHRVVGVDFAVGQLQVARDRAPGASFVHADARDLPLATDSFDGCWCLASLLHVPRADLPVALPEARRVLRPNARLFASVRHGEGTETTYRYGTDTGRHFVHWAPDAFAERFTDAGFAVEDVSVGGEWIQLLARA